ncbi:pantoate--beta-alanine ligase [Phycisphaerales bacterium AB-hyl4]|uniref:Pantothenate synthetase n=1 Tax=Natronomicrosphaera hydrolytica TaxID=3242702 RepID=A0ABV4UB48_9BACT
MQLTHSTADARKHRNALTGTVALVPTMGALHAGHLKLIEHGRSLADHVLVSIFVNPTQFGPGEDFDRYPRTLEVDLERCQAAGAAGVFAPSVDQMYPPAAPDVQVDVPELTSDLEGAFRPSHFAGVCRVVMKFFNVIQPDIAVFGQKDYQQLKVIQAMVADLLMPVRVVGMPTMREDDGLAMSSRNRYLSADDRRHAVGAYKALLQAKRMIEDDGETDPAAVERAMQQTLEAHHFDVDYAVLRHPQTLARLDCVEPSLTHGVAALIAARLDEVRLIDNMIIGASATA